MKKSAFTLAEIMIVLTVIGILTSILMPIAFHSAPDEDVMKFKTTYSTFSAAIRELVNSDKYYKDGDMGIRPDGVMIDGNHTGDIEYFCMTLGDVLNTKHVGCVGKIYTCGNDSGGFWNDSYKCDPDVWDFNEVDSYCTEAGTYIKQRNLKEYIELSNGAHIHEAGPECVYGIDYGLLDGGTWSARLYNNPEQWHHDDGVCIGGMNIDTIYKLVCIDIDKVGEGVEPFAIGVRADGKILPSPRAQEWLEKSVQKGE